jgi:biotin transport system substrate-specific component
MKTRELVRSAVYAGLICAVAIVFRFAPSALVPFSLLPLMVLLAGFVLGPRGGAAAMGVYALLGLLGIPVLAAPPFGGIGYVFKPSFGFILGYVAAAYAVGVVAGPGRRPGALRSVLAVLAGLLALYTVGLLYFYVVMNVAAEQSYSVIRVLQVGFAPFITLDLIKGLAASILGPMVNRLLR